MFDSTSRSSDKDTQARQRHTLLLVEDDARLAEQLRWALEDSFNVRHAADRPAAIQALERARPDLVLVDLCLPPGNAPAEGYAVLEAARRGGADTVVVVMSALEEREAALGAIEGGADDFFVKPVDLPTLRIVVTRALERQRLMRENARLKEELRGRFRVEGLIGVSAAMQQVVDSIRRVAGSPVTVILQGESGTGKGLVARAIHYNGARRDGPFVPVHCAGFPETLLEAELFGHEKGAFTGATAARIGRFEAANGGTLFLDEISCLTPATQTKLLRVLEERTIERLGSNQIRTVDIRLIAACNEDLAARVRQGEFREDLFFRINVFPIVIPPLRERREDIPVLAEHFLRRVSTQRGTPSRRLARETLDRLSARSWPGNVRELMNLIETVALMSDSDTIGPDLIPAEPVTTRQPIAGEPPAGSTKLAEAVTRFERNMIADAIARAGGVKAQAARDLGLAPSRMKYLVRKHGL